MQVPDHIQELLPIETYCHELSTDLKELVHISWILWKERKVLVQAIEILEKAKDQPIHTTILQLLKL